MLHKILQWIGMNTFSTQIPCWSCVHIAHSIHSAISHLPASRHSAQSGRKLATLQFWDDWFFFIRGNSENIYTSTSWVIHSWWWQWRQISSYSENSHKRNSLSGRKWIYLWLWELPKTKALNLLRFHVTNKAIATATHRAANKYFSFIPSWHVHCATLQTRWHQRYCARCHSITHVPVNETKPEWKSEIYVIATAAPHSNISKWIMQLNYE